MAPEQPDANQPWTNEELVAVVDDYLRMLAKQMAGEAYNKTEHRRALRKFLPERSEGSIEFKHANISAALEAMGLDYIDGYKPRRNFQQALLPVLCDRAERARPAWSAALQIVQDMTWAPPETISADVVVPPPEREPVGDEAREVVKPWIPRLVRIADWSMVEARNRSLGKAGEQFVVRFEREQLERAGRPALARNVRHVTELDGDGAGYDILSFERDGRKKYVEVKTTVSGPVAPFHVTRNEVEASLALHTQFVLTRVFNFRTHARLFELRGCIADRVRLEPYIYVARAG